MIENTFLSHSNATLVEQKARDLRNNSKEIVLDSPIVESIVIRQSDGAEEETVMNEDIVLINAKLTPQLKEETMAAILAVEEEVGNVRPEGFSIIKERNEERKVSFGDLEEDPIPLKDIVSQKRVAKMADKIAQVSDEKIKDTSLYHFSIEKKAGQP